MAGLLPLARQNSTSSAAMFAEDTWNGWNGMTANDQRVVDNGASGKRARARIVLLPAMSQ